jgi:hypothetical protein
MNWPAREELPKSYKRFDCKLFFPLAGPDQVGLGASVLTSTTLFDFGTTISATPAADSEECINFADPIIFTVINGEWPAASFALTGTRDQN